MEPVSPGSQLDSSLSTPLSQVCSQQPVFTLLSLPSWAPPTASLFLICSFALLECILMPHSRKACRTWAPGRWLLRKPLFSPLVYRLSLCRILGASHQCPQTSKLLACCPEPHPEALRYTGSQILQAHHLQGSVKRKQSDRLVGLSVP